MSSEDPVQQDSSGHMFLTHSPSGDWKDYSAPPTGESANCRGAERLARGPHLSKLVVGAVVLLDVMLFEPFDGFSVVHPLERPLGRLEVLGGEGAIKKNKKVM